MRNYQYNNLTIEQYKNRKKGFTPAPIAKKQLSFNEQLVRGFSLIEIVVAIAILTMIAGGMLNVFYQGFIAAKKSQNRTIAYSLGREKLEENYLWPPSSSIENYGAISEFPAFRRTVTVTPHPVYPVELRQVVVTVFWDSDQDSQSFTTLKADY